jgi:multidrug efflux pump subunit AcrA (membrane-fusion protein)
MFVKYLLPIVAVLAFSFALRHVVVAESRKPVPPPPVEPARSPFQGTVAATGLVEARSENISIGSPTSGIVEEVFVKVGQTVKAGDPLFRLDDRQRKAELLSRQAALDSAKAKLAKLERQPRPEEVPPLEAKLREAEANRISNLDLVKRARELRQRNAIADEELTVREQSYAVAAEQQIKAKADLDLLKAGAWEPDLRMARVDVAVAEAALKETQTELDRLLVTASVDGDVMQVNVRPGEFVGTPIGATPTTALVWLGDLRHLHLRVDIDEHDIGRFRPEAAAFAQVRGNTAQKFAIRFNCYEPFVIPKKSLTGDTSERVDTRVLQVIFAIDRSEASPRLFVGQQMDVFIEAADGKKP